MPVAPMARLQQKKQAAVTTGTGRIIRPSPRNGWNGLYVLSPGTGFLPPSPARFVKTWQRRLGLSTGRPGPHDFAVRIGSFVGMIAHAATRHAHRIPHPTLVTIAMRPSSGTGWHTIALFLENGN
ncbi:hypothetical protein SSBR45G_69280 [Bradyrhizobium sp. SSBR45G]|nr:hypothetical protein SSBR45G_69280 [Bradyrhizobium sp. SSBR45G]GLH85391.1 hypothetical protein SSBR45R_28510 [Bradyrhizobium sp. SSBR45R]